MLPKPGQRYGGPYDFPVTANPRPVVEVPSPAEVESRLQVLAEENRRLREAGAQLAMAALRVATEYDGVHRLLLAVSVWAKAMADENGRGGAPESEGSQQPGKIA